MTNNTTTNINNTIIERNVFFNIILVTQNERTINITGDILDLDIDFNINGFSKGNLLLNDVDYNIYNYYTILPGDTLIINIFNDISKVKIATKTYIINHVKPKTKDIKIANAMNLFKIDFISDIHYLNINKMISRGYNDTLTSDEIIKDIFEKDFYITKKDSRLNIGKSQTILENYFITYITPIEELKYLTKISTNTTEKDIFFLYENLAGYNFVPLSNLLAQAPKYRLNKDANPGLTTSGLPILRVLSEKFSTGINIYEIIKNGGIWNKYIYFDRTAKEIVEKIFKLDEDLLNSIMTLGSHSFITNSTVESCELPIFEITREDGLYADRKAYYKIRTEMFNTFIYKVKTNGLLDVSVGDLLSVDFLLSEDTLNNVFSGPWLVTEIKWKISNRDKTNKSTSYPTFKMDLTLAKDTINSIKSSKLIKTNQYVNNIF